MTRNLCAILFVGCAALGVSGCVAAVIPLAASGAIGGSRLRHHKQHAAGQQPADDPHPTPVVAALTVTASTPSSSGSVDAAARKGDGTDASALPPPTDGRPTSAMPLPVADTPAVAGAGRSPPAIWSDIMRFAAAASLEKPAVSALQARGSTGSSPHWVPCGDEPVAVLVNLPAPGTTFFDGAMDNLKAIETMGVTLVFMSDQPAPVVARQRRLLTAAAITAPVAGTTLFTGNPAMGPTIRATIGGHYCVAAVVGSRAADFPNATLPGAPGASPGWFLIR